MSGCDRQGLFKAGLTSLTTPANKKYPWFDSSLILLLDFERVWLSIEPDLTMNLNFKEKNGKSPHVLRNWHYIKRPSGLSAG